MQSNLNKRTSKNSKYAFSPCADGNNWHFLKWGLTPLFQAEITLLMQETKSEVTLNQTLNASSSLTPAEAHTA